MGISRDSPNFGLAPIVSGTGKGTSFKFCTRIQTIDGNKSPLQISVKVAVGVVRDSRKYSGNPYIERIARSSLRELSFLVFSVICE